MCLSLVRNCYCGSIWLQNVTFTPRNMRMWNGFGLLCHLPSFYECEVGCGWLTYSSMLTSCDCSSIRIYFMLIIKNIFYRHIKTFNLSVVCECGDVGRWKLTLLDLMSPGFCISQHSWKIVHSHVERNKKRADDFHIFSIYSGSNFSHNFWRLFIFIFNSQEMLKCFCFVIPFNSSFFHHHYEDNKNAFSLFLQSTRRVFF